MNPYILDETAKKNIQNVQKMINRKVSLIGKHNFYVSENEIKAVSSDVDHLPYTRIYRSNPFTNEAIMWEGDSGFRPRMNSFYAPNVVSQEEQQVDLCFQTPCSTVYPCQPPYLSKGDAMYETLQDRTCVRRFV